MPREKAIVNNCIDEIKNLGGYARKIHGDRYTAGLPDVIGCLDGRMLAIECKRPGKDATKLQAAELRKWRRAGAVSIVYRGEKNLESLIDT